MALNWLVKPTVGQLMRHRKGQNQCQITDIFECPVKDSLYIKTYCVLISNRKVLLISDVVRYSFIRGGSAAMSADHWSDRFNRNFEDGDLLLPAEVAEVVSANSDKIVSRRYVSDLATLHKLERLRPFPTVVLYKYEQVCSASII